MAVLSFLGASVGRGVLPSGCTEPWVTTFVVPISWVLCILVAPWNWGRGEGTRWVQETEKVCEGADDHYRSYGRKVAGVRLIRGSRRGRGLGTGRG